VVETALLPRALPDVPGLRPKSRPTSPRLGDSQLFKVVRENLAGKAWKFTSKTEDVRIESGVSMTRDETVYFVKDKWGGVRHGFLGELLATFQRLHREDEFPGTGIGVPLVQRVIHRFGGRVWAEGGVGQGATFFFTVNP